MITKTEHETYSKEDIDALKKEVEELQSITLIAMENLERELTEVAESTVILSKDELDSDLIEITRPIDIISMDPPSTVPLVNSIRKLELWDNELSVDTDSFC